MHRLSKSAFVACCFLLVIASCYYPKWKQQATEATIGWDVSGYYMYLPASFIYHDLKKCSFADSILTKYRPTPDFQQAFRHASGNYVMKYTMGQALMFTPFFFAGHLIALLTGYPADGFSLPYQFCISFGMILYAFTGLWFLRKILLRFFSDLAVAVTLLTIVAATNYLNYAAIDGGMTHNTLFTLYALLLYYTDRLFATRRPRFFAATCFIAALLTLIRPTEIICLLIPALWGIQSISDLKKRLTGITRSYKRCAAFIICFFIVLLPQFIYWKWVTGQWFVYTYRQEGFDWLHPHIINGLISYKAGWLVYTPVMIISLAGLVVLYRVYRKLFWCVFFFFACFLYICFSWKEWWYGASLGQRAMIQAYPVLCLPLAALVDAIRKKNNAVVKWAMVCFMLACTCYNLWLTHQAHRGGLFKGGETTRSYFWATLGRFNVPNETATLLDNEESYDGGDQPVKIFSSAEEQQLNKEVQSAKEFFFAVRSGQKWLRAEAIFTTPQKEWDTWKMPQFIIKCYRDSSLVKVNFIRVSRVLNNGETKTLHLDAQVPETCNKASVSAWNAGSDKQLIIKNIEVSGW